MNLQHAYMASAGISAENIAFYKDFGYLIAPSLVRKEEVAELRREATQIFRGKRGAVEGLVSVRESESDEEVLRKYLAIHFPHKLSPVIKRYLSHKGILEVLGAVVSPNVKCMQSMLFIKAPGKAGQSWHQDEYYIPTRDKSLIGAWIAIDDANIENGCLWIIPGSHKPGYIRNRISNMSGEYADADTIDVTAYPRELQVPVEVKSGTVVFFNGYTLHSSLRNKTNANFRTALVNHYMSAESMLPWDQDGKLPPSEDLRDIVMVQGEDPYAYKGIQDLNKPYLRPEISDISKK